MKQFYWPMILFVILLCSCNKKPNTAEYTRLFEFEEETICIPYRFNPEDSIYVNLEKYLVNEKLFPLLDSIIHSMETCPRFNASKTGFHLWSKYSKGYHVVYLGTVKSTFFYNTAGHDGIFFYKDYNFYYEGHFIDSFFKRTGEFIQYKGVHPDKYMTDIDDTELYWRYILNNDQLQLIDYLNCDDWWHDENYQEVH